MDDISIIRNINYYNKLYKNIIRAQVFAVGLECDLDLIQDFDPKSEIAFMVKTIKEYAVTKLINEKPIYHNKKKYQVCIAAIVYYYYHIVLIETHYNEYLQTVHIKDFLYDYLYGYKLYYLFIEIINDLIKGDDEVDSNVRKQFICLNNEAFV